jgi:hypothetical protein
VSTYNQFYLDQQCCAAGPAAPSSGDKVKQCYWNDISSGVAPGNLNLLYGGGECSCARCCRCMRGARRVFELLAPTALFVCTSRERSLGAGWVTGASARLELGEGLMLNPHMCVALLLARSP